MRILNIIEIENNNIMDITSYPIIDEQMSLDIIANAEDYFIKRCVDNGLTYPELIEENDLDEFDINQNILDDGYYKCNDNKDLYLSWSTTVND
jgi:hypothetical protein